MLRCTAFALALAIAGVAGPALAQADSGLSPADEIVSTLRSRGYDIVERERTWLGRERILAEKDGMSRELVFIPGTGEILRDYATRKEGSKGQKDHSLAGGMETARSGGNSGVVGTPDATPSVSVGDSVSVAGDGASPGVAVGDVP